MYKHITLFITTASIFLGATHAAETISKLQIGASLYKQITVEEYNQDTGIIHIKHSKGTSSLYAERLTSEQRTSLGVTEVLDDETLLKNREQARAAEAAAEQDAKLAEKERAAEKSQKFMEAYSKVQSQNVYKGGAAPEAINRTESKSPLSQNKFFDGTKFKVNPPKRKKGKKRR